MDGPIFCPLSESQQRSLREQSFVFIPMLTEHQKRILDDPVWEEQWTIVDPPLVVHTPDLGGES